MAYFSNSDEGSILDAQCAECPIGRHPDAPCPILLVQLHYNYEQHTDGMPNKIAEVLNSLIDKDGICKMKPVIKKYASADVGAGKRDPRNILPGMESFAKKAGLI